MGRKLDALLGRNFRASKFKAITTLAISRIAILKRQRQSRFSQAKSDVTQLLKLDQHERALIRVELVVKDRLMLDAFDMIQSYCEFLKERVLLLQKTKECPDELKESISSLIFASSRCAEFPELQEMRAVFQMQFGKEFVARAIELRNSCAVNPKVYS
ncbi:IST1-like protein [Linum grandiflorum]